MESESLQAAKTSKRKAIKAVFGTVAGALWILALFLEAYSDGTPGVMCLVGGWMMIILGNPFAFLAWFGNIPFLTGYFMFLFGKKVGTFAVSIALSSVAVIFSIGALTVNKTTDYLDGITDPVGVSAGAYVWMLSLFVLFAGCILNLLKGSR